MIRVVLGLFAVLLAAVAGYLWMHRSHHFLMHVDVPKPMQRTLRHFSEAFLLAAILALAAAIWPNKWLITAALIYGAGTGAVLGIQMPKFMV